MVAANFRRTHSASQLLGVRMESTLEVFLNDMRYINPRFTYLLTYLLKATTPFTL